MSIDSTCQQGKIVKIDNEYIYVQVLQQSACANCHSKSLCNLSESKESVFKIKNEDSQLLVDDLVNLAVSEKKGLLAVLIAYVAPITLFIISLFLMIEWRVSEPLSVLSSFAFMSLYFYMVYRFNSKLTKRFAITIQKKIH